MVNDRAKNDLDFKIIRNLHHKKFLSEHCAENTVHQRLVNYNIGRNGVDKAQNALEWINELDESVKSAVENISDIRLDKTLSGATAAERMEQERLKVLYKMDWSYSGNFQSKQMASYFPELSFEVRTRRMNNTYWYEASYGIVKGVKSRMHGTYSLFLTLHDALEFIRNEAATSGYNSVNYHVSSDIIRKAMDRRGVQELSDKEKGEILSEESSIKKKNEYLKVLQQGNIEEHLRIVERSADIMPLLDFIPHWLVKLAQSRLNDAIKHQEISNRARGLEDSDERVLDKPMVMTPQGSVVSSSDGRSMEPLPTPEKVREEEADAVVSNILGKKRKEDTSGNLDDSMPTRSLDDEDSSVTPLAEPASVVASTVADEPGTRVWSAQDYVENSQDTDHDVDEDVSGDNNEEPYQPVEDHPSDADTDNVEEVSVSDVGTDTQDEPLDGQVMTPGDESSYDEGGSTEDEPVWDTPVEDTPIEENPVEDTPVEDTFVEDAPVEETPVEDTPVEDTFVEDTPVEDTPIEDTPVEETPIEDTPVEETPIEDTPVEETPIEDTPVEDTPIEDTPVEGVSDEETPVEGVSGEDTHVEENPVEDTHVEVDPVESEQDNASYADDSSYEDVLVEDHAGSDQVNNVVGDDPDDDSKSFEESDDSAEDIIFGDTQVDEEVDSGDSSDAASDQDVELVSEDHAETDMDHEVRKDNGEISEAPHSFFGENPDNDYLESGEEELAVESEADSFDVIDDHGDDVVMDIPEDNSDDYGYQDDHGVSDENHFEDDTVNDIDDDVFDISDTPLYFSISEALNREMQEMDSNFHNFYGSPEVDDTPVEENTEDVSDEEYTTSESDYSDETSEDAVVEETPVEGVSDEETPADADVTSFEETPVEGVSDEENPADADVTSFEETPVEGVSDEENPVEDTPVEDTPVEETPVEGVSDEENPVEENPVEDTPVEETPVEGVSDEENPVEENPVEDAHVEEENISSGRIDIGGNSDDYLHDENRGSAGENFIARWLNRKR